VLVRDTEEKEELVKEEEKEEKENEKYNIIYVFFLFKNREILLKN